MFGLDPHDIGYIILGLIALASSITALVQSRSAGRVKLQMQKMLQESQRLTNEGKPLDAVSSLSVTVNKLIEQQREESRENRSTVNAMLDHMSKAAEDYRTLGDARTRQIDKQLGLTNDQAESISALQTGQDTLNRKIESQGPTLEETHRIVKGMQEKIDQLPEENKKLLETFLAKMEADWTTFKSEMVQSVVDAMIKQQAPPATLPEPPAKEADATGPMPQFGADAKPILPTVEAKPL